MQPFWEMKMHHKGYMKFPSITLKTGESYDRTTTIVDIYFSVMIAKILKNDPDPKTMAECKRCSD
jgi:hypothetical protein